MPTSCDWNSVIAAIALSIPVLVAQVVMLVQLAVSKEKQKVMIQQNRDIISEQIHVKEALNGSQQKILDNQEKLIETVNGKANGSV
jgi:hypothetical protein